MEPSTAILQDLVLIKILNSLENMIIYVVRKVLQPQPTTFLLVKTI